MRFIAFPGVLAVALLGCAAPASAKDLSAEVFFGNGGVIADEGIAAATFDVGATAWLAERWGRRNAGQARASSGAAVGARRGVRAVGAGGPALERHGAGDGHDADQGGALDGAAGRSRRTGVRAVRDSGGLPAHANFVLGAVFLAWPSRSAPRLILRSRCDRKRYGIVKL